MSTVLSVYTKKAFCEFLLPALNNADDEIVLKKNVFGFESDVVLQLEVVDSKWYLKETEDYTFEKQRGSGDQMEDGDIIAVNGVGGEKISVIVAEKDNTFSVFGKYDISNIDNITIGSEGDNDIIYEGSQLVSRHHAKIVKEGGLCVIYDSSSNGTFVNSKRIEGKCDLAIGDCISVFGLKIVYLGAVLAVLDGDESSTAVSRRLRRFAQNFAEAKKVAVKGKKFFHRSPRNYTKLETDAIEIEAPPAPKSENKRPLWMVIGPSFTMMLPMLAGTVMSIMSARSSGQGASAYMYTGIITSVGSAMIGVFWALANIRQNKKEIQKSEKARFKAYSDYLIKRAEYIREKYEKSRNILLTNYPSAQAVVDYTAESPELWNRNSKHSDFMCQRLGCGNILFQMDINVPKEKFSMLTDELSEKPRLIKEEYKVLYDVPVNVDLLANKLIGVVGGDKKKGAFDIVRILSSQIAANNCYTDVKLVYIFDDNKDEENWDYTHWFPHVWSEDKKTRYVASNKTEASDVLFELTQILRFRAEEEKNKKKDIPKPYYVLVVSDAELLEGELITKYIYECDPSYGLTTLILAESKEQLPNQCEYLIEKDAEFSGICNLTVEDNLPLAFDEISAEQLECFARRLLPIEVKEVEKGRDIPAALNFLEMYDVQRLEDLDIEEKWRKNRTYENMKAMIGAKAGGAPCYLDVHEKYHGPHGLVAGTTGSGKSETLQTYMLSLAMNFSPDDIGFFIIDYKGGGMAGLFDGLPHMIGAISNLSGNQVRRAMVSIKSENRRRQRIFTENNVNNINLYTKLYKNGEADIPVPHMFIIIDEFAELKREEPEFMKELISVAQVGRSLGVHLILATQKPSGTVDDNIWSNSKFKLCLRVQDRQDSNDMLHKPDAAYITQAGRGYLQVGNDEVYELFQSGYSGAVYAEDGTNVKTEIATLLSLTGKAALIGNSIKSKQQEKVKVRWISSLLEVLKQLVDKSELAAFAAEPQNIKFFFDKLAENKIDYPYSDYNGRRLDDLISAYAEVCNEFKDLSEEEEARAVLAMAEKLHKKLPEKKAKTQLDAVIEYLGKIAQQEGYTHQMQLWLPLLPTVMHLSDLPGYGKNVYADGNWPQPSSWNLAVPVGLCDDPVNQAQMPLIIDFAENGHLAVCGSIVSGKSSFLQTLLFALINKYRPDWLNIYAIDFSSRMLSAIEKAPHVGGVMYEDDTEMIDKFFHMMEKIIEERKKMFRGGNYSQYVQVNGVKVPAIMIAIDNVGAFREKTENKYDERLIRLAKEGISYGIYLALTAAGFSSAEITTKLGDNIKNVVCLQMSDKFAYADALRNNAIDVIPENNVKGRGLTLVGERVLEFQTVLALEAEDDFNRIDSIKQKCADMNAAWTGKHAKLIPVIPEKPVWAEYEQLDDVKEMSQNSSRLPVGYDMSSADVYGIDLSKIFTYLVSGKARMGKTNMLKAMIRSAAAKQGNVVVIELEGSELKNTATAVEATYITTQAEQAQFFADLLEPFKARNAKKRAMLEAGKDEFEIYEGMQDEKPYFIIVSDMVSFIQSIYKPEAGVTNIRGFVENIADKGKLHNVFFFIGINPDNISSILGLKAYESFIGHHTGMHLGGAVNNIRYFDFSNVSYIEQSKVLKAGIGMLPTANDEAVDKVVIPLVRG